MPAPPFRRDAASAPTASPRLTPRPPSRSRPRTWLMAGAISLAAHVAVLLPVLFAQRGAPPVWPKQEAAPVMVTLFEPPPRPEPAPAPAADPQPPAGPQTPTPAAPPAKARPTPPPPAPRPSRASVPPPPEVETIVARAPAPPAPMATLSDAQLAGATVAGPGGGVGGRGGGGGTGGGGGSGAGDGGCDMVRWLQDALRDDPEVRAAVTRAQGEVGPGRALLVWNGDWIRNPGEAGEGLAGVRQAIAMEVAFAPQACRAQPMRGLVLIRFSDAAGGPRLVLGKGAWRWGDMLRGR